MMIGIPPSVNRHKGLKKQNTYCNSVLHPPENGAGIRCGCNGGGECRFSQDSSEEGREKNSQALQGEFSGSHPKRALLRSYWKGISRETDPVGRGNSGELISGKVEGCKRLWVVGSWAAGKTSLAKQLGQVLDVEPVHLDEIRFKPGWRLVDPPEVRRQVKELLKEDSWVVDGSYSRVGRDLARRADLVIWLDPPFLSTWLILAIRSIKRMKHHSKCCGGNVELWRELFTPRNSVIWKFPRKYFSTKRRLAKSIRLFPHLRLRKRNFTKIISLIERVNCQARVSKPGCLVDHKNNQCLKNNGRWLSRCSGIARHLRVDEFHSENNGFAEGRCFLLSPQGAASKKEEDK
jgi:adenylate kinase family enzyme